MPSVSLSTKPLNNKFSFVSSILDPASKYFSKTRLTFFITASSSSADNNRTGSDECRSEAILMYISANQKSGMCGSQPIRDLVTEIKAGLKPLSNAWLAGSGGGCFNMATAAKKRDDAGIFWMNEGIYFLFFNAKRFIFQFRTKKKVVVFVSYVGQEESKVVFIKK